MNNLEITFLGSFYPKDRYKEILEKSAYLDFAGNALQWSLINGFNIIGCSINAITVPATKRFKGFYLNDSSFSHNGISLDYCVGFGDIKGLKHIHTSFKIRNILVNSIKRPKYLFIYSIQNNLLRAACFFKKKYPETKIILLVTDLSENMSESTNLIYRTFKNIEIHENKKFIELVDGFILLSKYMKDRIHLKNKPYIVMEGIFNPDDEVFNNQYYKENKTRKILYTGTLAKRYGIMNLVESFHSINNEDIELIIVGDGDSKKDIVSLTLIDSRIKYLGVLDRSKVLQLQKVAQLLVNPRTPEGNYVKYSFPSKTMEYLASGTPTLMYKLPGIPNEYYDYCYTVKELGIESLTNAIQNVLSKSTDELDNFGKKARNFILTNKSPQAQCQKIIDFIKTI